jgi:hypothetical protein
LSEGHDEFRWNLQYNGKFTVSSLYNAIIQPEIPVDKNKKLWKMKMPLKIRIFGCYLHRGLTLTKDNHVKHNWLLSMQCVLYHHNETIKHLFFQCRFASCIQVASDLYAPTSVVNIFGNWLHGTDHGFRMFIRVGALAIIWSLWLCRNDKVFNDKNYSLLQVIYRCTATLRSWSALQNAENRDLFTKVYTRLEDTARDTFFLHGWQHDLRIRPPLSS